MGEYDRREKKQESRAIAYVQRKSQKDEALLEHKHGYDCHCCGCTVQRMQKQISIQRMCDNNHKEHPTGPCPDPYLKVVYTNGHTKISDGGEVSTTKSRRGKQGVTRTRSSLAVLKRAKSAYESDNLTYVRTDDNDIIYSMPRQKGDSIKGPRYCAVHRGGGDGSALEMFEVPNLTRGAIGDEFSDSESEEPVK